METQRIAQIQHERCKVNEQKHESDRINHFRHGGEDRGRCHFADRGGHEQSGRHAVEQSVPGDGAVPTRCLGHRAVRVTALPAREVWSKGALMWSFRAFQGLKRNTTTSSEEPFVGIYQGSSAELSASTQ
jgi:hypothetical protein